MATRIKLSWKRATYRRNEAANHKIWTTSCGQYRVIRSRTIGPRTFSIRVVEIERAGKTVKVKRRVNDYYPDVFYVQRWTDDGWIKIDQKSAEKAAKKICEKEANAYCPLFR